MCSQDARCDDLRTVRERAALTISELAAASGVNEAAIWRAEAGRVKPSAATRRRLAAALGMAPARIRWPGVAGEPRQRRCEMAAASR